MITIFIFYVQSYSIPCTLIYFSLQNDLPLTIVYDGYFLSRYENIPPDYCSLLGPIHGHQQQQQRSTSPVSGAREAALERSKNASAAFLTLSRYLKHQRWIYSLQNCPARAGTMTQASVARILSTICKTRIQQGFSFAHSSKGVQNMVLEVPMVPEDDEEEVAEAETSTSGASGCGGNLRSTASQSCVIQYIIFPPHITTTAASDGLSEDDFAGGGGGSSSKDGDGSTEADGEVQIILEVWTEPQDGLVSSDYGLAALAGKRAGEIAGAIFPGDLECISTLVTFEHLIMMCQNPCIPSPHTDTFALGHDIHGEKGGASGTSSRYRQESGHICGGSYTTHGNSGGGAARTTIQQVPFAFNLVSLLPKAHQTEMIFSLLIQDLSAGVPDMAYSIYSTLKPLADRPNEMLFETFIKELSEATDRELSLSTSDCQKLPELIGSRQSSNFHFPQTPPTNLSSRHSFHSSSISSHHRGPTTAGPPHKTSFNNNNDSGSRRYPSGNSCTSSLADTYRDIHSSQQEYSTMTSAAELYPTAPKWRCFLKAISPTHIVLTVLPASYEDLKSLTASPETLDGQHPDIVDVIKKALPSECNDMMVASLDDISINSSIPNLEVVGRGETGNNLSGGGGGFGGPNNAGLLSVIEPKSPRIDNLQALSRQRSGSDMFEMNRPKVPTQRKSSGEPAVMRDRTVSLDGLSQFRAKAQLRKRLKERTKERDRTDSLELRNSRWV